jgi:hypothetical protein
MAARTSWCCWCPGVPPACRCVVPTRQCERRGCGIQGRRDRPYHHPTNSPSPQLRPLCKNPVNGYDKSLVLSCGIPHCKKDDRLGPVLEALRPFFVVFLVHLSMIPYLARSNQATCGSKAGGGLPRTGSGQPAVRCVGRWDRRAQRAGLRRFQGGDEAADMLAGTVSRQLADGSVVLPTQCISFCLRRLARCRLAVPSPSRWRWARWP